MTDMTQTTERPSADPLRKAANLALVTLLVIAGGDALLFGAEPGINLFVFALVLTAGIVLVNLRHFQNPLRLVPVAISLVAALPLIETPSIIGVLLALLGLAMLSLGSVRLLPGKLDAMPLMLFRFAAGPVPAGRGRRQGRESRLGMRLSRMPSPRLTPLTASSASRNGARMAKRKSISGMASS